MIGAAVALERFFPQYAAATVEPDELVEKGGSLGEIKRVVFGKSPLDAGVRSEVEMMERNPGALTPVIGCVARR